MHSNAGGEPIVRTPNPTPLTSNVAFGRQTGAKCLACESCLEIRGGIVPERQIQLKVLLVLLIT
jgi:hypothetical protein